MTTDTVATKTTNGAARDERHHVSAAAIVDLIADVFGACGMGRDDAVASAELMAAADLVGSDAHGVFRLSQYANWLQAGRINPAARITIAQRGPSTALVDGDNGMGHLTMAFAARTAVEIARETGVAWVGVRHSNHAGAASLYAEIPMMQGMVGIYAAASSVNHMAPWGGSEAMIGTNPIAIAIPAGEEPPIVLDIATSISSFGAIKNYALQGKPLPEGWVVDPQSGKPITDASRANEGLLLPIGGYKGSGLALILGLLAGPLNGAAFGQDVEDFVSGRNKESNTGQFVIALDVTRFLPLDVFKAAIDRHIRDLRSSPPLPGFSAVRLPGEERQSRKQQREKDGVPLPPPLLKQLDDLAVRFKVSKLRR